MNTGFPTVGRLGGQPPRHIYIHVPFCARRCSYCDFSIAVRRVVPVDEYLGALGQELALLAPETGRWGGQWLADTLYMGGGTPSRLGGHGVARLVSLVRQRAELTPGAEVTVEANPEDITSETVDEWRAAGVNRVSLGAQSFNEDALAWMHRSHGAPGIAEAVHQTRSAGITDISIDLIFALPGAVGRNWEEDIERALELRPTHISLYGLTVEPRTPLGRWRERGEVVEAPEERYASEYLLANELLTAAGYEHYEVSNFALPGHRARHNSAYWRVAPYAAFGPSAHAFDGANRRWNVAPYSDWVRHLEAGCDPLAGEESLTPANRVAESVYLGLRTTDGLRLQPGELGRITSWLDAGWGVAEGGVLRLSPLGWLRLDSLAAALTAQRSP